jgi:hypothetical protein
MTGESCMFKSIDTNQNGGFDSITFGNNKKGKVRGPLLTFDPYTTLFYCNGKVSLHQGLLSQRFSLLVVIDWFFAMKVVSWP